MNIMLFFPLLLLTLCYRKYVCVYVP